MFVRALAVACLGLCFAFHNSARASTPASSLQAIALTRSDVPLYLIRVGSETTTNAHVAALNRVSPTIYAKLGRVLGYDIIFARRTQSGLDYLQAWVAQYRTAKNAVTGMMVSAERTHLLTYAYPGYHWHQSRAHNLQEQTCGCTCGNQRQTVDMMDATQGRFSLSVEVDFVAGTTSLSAIHATAMQYLTIMLQRAQQAPGS
jgi:hypothetical protein